MKKLTQDTLIPIGFAIASIGTGAIWGTSLQTAVATHERRLNESQVLYQSQSKEICNSLHSLHEKVSEIQGELKRIVPQRRP